MLKPNKMSSRRKSYRRGHTSKPRKTKCLYCNLDIEASSTSQKSHSVEFDKFITEILNCCSKGKDYWSHHVKSTIEYYQRDLFAFDVVYHDQCDINFRTGKNIPLKFRDRVNPDLLNPLLKRGRQEHASLKNAFLKTCEFMEGNEQQFTLSQLSNKMQEFISEEGLFAYIKKYMKEKISNYFGDEVVYSSSTGKKNYCNFKKYSRIDYSQVLLGS